MSITSEPWTNASAEAKRMGLFQVPLPVMQALRDSDLASAQKLSTFTLTPYLISDECRGAWRRRCAQIATDAADAPWVARLVVSTDTGVVVGRAGFHAPPNDDGMVEVGYAIDHLHRRQGYARGALEILLKIARTHPLVKRVRATVLPENMPSRALVQSCGFVEVGVEFGDDGRKKVVLEIAVQ